MTENLTPLVRGSDINAFLTTDCEIPNCRAMRDGVIPALKATRTALSFPDVKAMGTGSACRLRGLLCDTATFLPRRFCPASTAESNRSRSRSLSRLIALAKSLGRICGNGVAVVPLPKVCENRSRVVDRECALFIQGMTPPSVPRSNRTFCVGASGFGTLKL